MISSGIKRTLAVTAVSALAVTGIPALAGSASANTVNEQAAASGIQLYNLPGTPVSVKNDGTDTTVRLEAGAEAATNSVTFQYKLAAGNDFVDIATVSRNDDGAFSFEWNATALANSTGVTLRAVDAADPAVSDDATGVDIKGGGDAADTINLSTASATGVFQQPYTMDGQTEKNVIASGTASSDDDSNALLAVAKGDGTFGPLNPLTFDAPAAGTTATFKQAIDIGAANYTFGATNELVLGTQTDTQDFESYTLYNQSIATVTATADRTNIPAGAPDTDVTVTVKDQNGNAIAGAQVFRSDGAGPEYTGENGEATFTQGAGTFSYYANATDSNPFEADLGDKKSGDVTVTDGTTPPPPVDIKAVLHATNRNPLDKLRVSTSPDATRAKVIFYKKKDGQLKRIATGWTGPEGNATKKVEDRNGKKETKYFALVKSTETTNSDFTNRSITR